MKRKDELLTGLIIGTVVGLVFTAQLAQYMPLLVIAGIVLFARLLPR